MADELGAASIQSVKTYSSGIEGHLTRFTLAPANILDARRAASSALFDLAATRIWLPTFRTAPGGKAVKPPR